MSVRSVAVIGKDFAPLYLREFSDFPGGSDGDDNGNEEPDISEEELFGIPGASASPSAAGLRCSIRHQFLLHAALDRYDQLAGQEPGLAWRNPSATGNDAMFVGLLCPVEEMRVYGYMTTTKVLILLVIDDEYQQESEIRALMTKIHKRYVDYTMNPFIEIGGPIRSARFDRTVQKYCVSFNQTVGMI